MQYSVTYSAYNNWLVPLNLAVGFHLVLAFSVLFLPGIFKPKPKFEDIYTVNLVNISEPTQQQAAPEAVIQPPPEPAKTETAVSIPDVAEPPPVVKPVKPVSIKPLKRKLKKKVKAEPVKKKELERIKRQTIAEALRAEQNAAEQARRAAEEAARQQRLLEQQLTQIRKQSQSLNAPPRSSRSGGSNALSGLENQYFLSIKNRIIQYYTLPQFKSWDDSTEAVVVIKISKNGTILNQFFEKRSNDPTFDQFVYKTIQKANPLPPFPPAFKKKSWEIGLRFSPEGIQN